jgi:hypothetical protein
MRPALALSLVAALALGAAPSQVAAQSRSVSIDGLGRDSVRRLVPRFPMRGADALVSRDGLTALLLVDRTLFLQPTNEGVERMLRAGRDAERKASGQPLATAVASAVGSVMRSLAEQAIEYDLRDLGEARWADGKLLLRRRSGEDVFGDLVIDGRRVLEDFDPDQARDFAARVRAASR